MYPAIAKLPLVLVQLENDTVTLCFSSFVFVDSLFLHLLGLLLVKPYLMGITTMD